MKNEDELENWRLSSFLLAVQVILIEIDTLFHQLSQNMTTIVCQIVQFLHKLTWILNWVNSGKSWTIAEIIIVKLWLIWKKFTSISLLLTCMHFIALPYTTSLQIDFKYLSQNTFVIWVSNTPNWMVQVHGWRTFQPRTFQSQASTPDLSTPNFSTINFLTPDFSTPWKVWRWEVWVW